MEHVAYVSFESELDFATYVQALYGGPGRSVCEEAPPNRTWRVTVLHIALFV